MAGAECVVWSSKQLKQGSIDHDEHFILRAKYKLLKLRYKAIEQGSNAIRTTSYYTLLMIRPFTHEESVVFVCLLFSSYVPHSQLSFTILHLENVNVEAM